MEITIDNIKLALSKVIEPDLNKDIISLDLVENLTFENNTIKLTKLGRNFVLLKIRFVKFPANLAKR